MNVLLTILFIVTRILLMRLILVY